MKQIKTIYLEDDWNEFLKQAGLQKKDSEEKK
jgi:hypothetical protein